MHRQAPAGSVARERFDELAMRLPHAPKTHPVVTRSDGMLTWLLRHGHRLLALLPLSFVRPHLAAGELAEIRVGDPIPLDPLGLLRPSVNAAEASTQLAGFLDSFFPFAAARSYQASR